MNWRRKGNNVDVIARDSNDVPVARFTVNWPCVNQKYGSQFYSIVICFFFYYYLLLCFQAAHNHLAIPNERSRLRTNIRTSNTHRTIRRNKKQKTDGGLNSTRYGLFRSTRSLSRSATINNETIEKKLSHKKRCCRRCCEVQSAQIWLFATWAARAWQRWHKWWASNGCNKSNSNEK